MTRTKKKFLIIFFSILSGIIIILGIVIYVLFTVENNTIKNVDDILDFVSKDNHYVYNYLEETLIYKGEHLNLDKIIDNSKISIEYVCEDYIIYSSKEKNERKYYSIDCLGKQNLMFDSDIDIEWNYYKDGIFYTDSKDEFYTYNIEQSLLTNVTADEYFSNINNRYQIIPYSKSLVKIIDVNTSMSKYVSMNMLLENETLQKVSECYRDLAIYECLVRGQDIYIVIYINYLRAVTIKYDFNSESFTFVDKIKEAYWDSDFKMFYLENQICKPLEALINHKNED